jgi:SAM-dependent methyltransferase
LISSKEYIKGYFRERAIAFPDFYSRRPLLPIEAWIVDQIPPNSKVLDLCCGGGEIASAMAEKGATVTGVDYVPEMIELATKLFEEWKLPGLFEVGDATNLPFADSTFSHVVCAGSSLNSMNNEDARLTMLEAARVVEPGGFVYHAILNPISLRSIAAVGKGILQRAPMWAFYSQNRYGIQPGEDELPRGMFYVINPLRMSRYKRETGLAYKSMRWDIGFMGCKASMTLLIGRKV